MGIQLLLLRQAHLVCKRIGGKKNTKKDSECLIHRVQETWLARTSCNSIGIGLVPPLYATQFSLPLNY